MVDDDRAEARSFEGLVPALASHALMRTGAFDLTTGGRVAGAVPLVYIDKNPWGRTLDDPSVPRNVAEATAFAAILDRLRNGSVRLVYSSISFGEGSPRDGALSASTLALREVIQLHMLGVPVIVHDERDDTALVADFVYQTFQISGHDAIHAAASLLEGAWYFVTSDDRLRRRLARLYSEWSLPATAVTPVTLVPLLDDGARIQD